MFCYFSNRAALGKSLNRPIFEGVEVGGNHLIFRRTERRIIRNWEPKNKIIEEELRN